MILINKTNIIKYGKIFLGLGQGELKLHEKVLLHDGDFPIKQVCKIHSTTIVIKSLIEKK